MTIWNCTPHEINIYSSSDCDMSNPRRIYIKEGVKPVKTIAPSGTILNAVLGKTNGDILDGIQLVSVSYDSVDNPFNVEGSSLGDHFIVSALYKTAYLACHPDTYVRLLTVDSVVYSDPTNPRPCGCLALAI